MVCPNQHSENYLVDPGFVPLSPEPEPLAILLSWVRAAEVGPRSTATEERQGPPETGRVEPSEKAEGLGPDSGRDSAQEVCTRGAWGGQHWDGDFGLVHTALRGRPSL